MEILVYILIGIVIGAIAGWLFAHARINSSIQLVKDDALQRFNDLEKEYVGYKATTISQLQIAEDNLKEKIKEIADFKETIKSANSEISDLNTELSTVTANLKAGNQTISEKNKDLEAVKEELKKITNELSENNKELATAKANNEALNEKLQTQKDEMEALGKKFNTEFENIANKILETKSEKFTELNKTNLKTILEPLGKNITEFKTKVEEVYDKESKERFSL